MAAGLTEILAGDHHRPPGREELRRGRFRIEALQSLRHSDCKSGTLRYVAQQALASPIIEFFGASSIVGLLTFGAHAGEDGQP